MKKLLVCILALLLLMGAACAEPAGFGDVLLQQGITPGITVETVRAAESDEIQETAMSDTQYALYGWSPLAGEQACVTYVFEQGVLISANYTQQQLIGQPSALTVLREALTQRLGEGRDMSLAEVTRITRGPDADLSSVPEVQCVGWQLPGTTWLFIYEADGYVYASICLAAQ